MTEVRNSRLFALEESSIGSPVRVYEWRDYRIKWDVVYDMGSLYLIVGDEWKDCVGDNNGLSFEQLASIAVVLNGG